MTESLPTIVVVQATGHDHRIADLDSLTDSPLYNRKQQWPSDDGTVVDFIELAAVANAIDGETAVELAQVWIETHYALLGDLEADLMIEFQTAVAPDAGSNALVLPAAFVKLLASLNASVVHQYSQAASPSDHR